MRSHLVNLSRRLGTGAGQSGCVSSTRTVEVSRLTCAKKIVRGFLFRFERSVDVFFFPQRSGDEVGARLRDEPLDWVCGYTSVTAQVRRQG